MTDPILPQPLSPSLCFDRGVSARLIISYVIDRAQPLTQFDCFGYKNVSAIALWPYYGSLDLYTYSKINCQALYIFNQVRSIILLIHRPLILIDSILRFVACRRCRSWHG